MNHKRTARIREALTPSDSAIESLYEKIETYEQRKTANVKLAMAFIIILFVAGASILIIKPLMRDNNNSALQATNFEEYYGLPKVNFINENMTAQLCRLYIYEGITDFIDPEISLVILRVNNVEESNSVFGIDLKVSATLLKTINGESVNDAITFHSGRSEPITSVWDEKDVTEGIRVGGVYIIPLMLTENGDYQDVGLLDVLYEITDEGNIDSHSRYHGHYKFDGIHISKFLDIINHIQNSDLIMSNIELSRTLERYSILKIDTIEIVASPTLSDGPHTLIGTARTTNCLGLNCESQIKIVANTLDDLLDIDFSTIEYAMYDYSYSQQWVPITENLSKFLLQDEFSHKYINQSEQDLLKLITDIQSEFTYIDSLMNNTQE